MVERITKIFSLRNFLRSSVFSLAMISSGARLAVAGQDDSIQVLFDAPMYRPQVNQNWYSSACNLETDSGLFRKKVDDKFSQMQSRIQTLKQTYKRDGARDPKQKAALADLEKKLAQSKGKYKVYKAVGSRAQSEARAEFEKTMSALDENLAKTSRDILPEKESFQVESRTGLEDRQYQIEQMKRALAGMEKPFRIEIMKDVDQLEQKRKEISENLEKAVSAQDESWKSKQDAIGSGIQDFDQQYFDTLGEIKTVRDVKLEVQ